MRTVGARRPTARRSAVVLLVAVALAACGAGSSRHAAPESKAEPTEGVGIVRAGSTAQFADCRDWNRGTVRARRVTIRSIRDQLTRQDSTTAESALSDGAAYRLFDKTCSSGVADTVRLYKLYARAQAFAPLASAARAAGN